MYAQRKEDALTIDSGPPVVQTFFCSQVPPSLHHRPNQTARAHLSDFVLCPSVLPTSLPRSPTQTDTIDRDAWQVIVQSQTKVDPQEIALEVHRHRFQLAICRAYKVLEAGPYLQSRGFQLKVNFQKMKMYFLGHKKRDKKRDRT